MRTVRSADFSRNVNTSCVAATQRIASRLRGWVSCRDFAAGFCPFAHTKIASMSDPIRIADHIWKDGGSLVDRLEHLSRSDAPADVVVAEAVNGLQATSGAAACTLHLVETDQTTLLARTGIDVSTTAKTNDVPRGRSAIASWPDPNTLSALEACDSDSYTQLVLRFERPPESTLAQPLAELAEAVLQMVTQVHLREQYNLLRKASATHSRSQAWQGRMYGGVTVNESFVAIAETLAEATSSDRVCLLKNVAGHFQLVASSTQPAIDGRSQQVRLIESLVTSAIANSNEFRFVVGSQADAPTDISFSDSLQRYLVSSGTRSVHIQAVQQSDGTNGLDANQTVAAIVIESFHGSVARDQTHPSAVITTAEDAIRLALARDASHSGWSNITNRFGRIAGSHKVMAAAVVAMVSAALLFLVPCEFKLPVDGRIVPKQHQSVFAPMDANIAEVFVRNEQTVKQGDALLRLRSPELTLLKQQLQGELATAKTQLAALAASGAVTAAADAVQQEVLNSKISGLQNQLSVVDQRMTELVITCPIDGIIDRWDLQQALRLRPVAHGDYLLRVIAPQAGWEVELEIPAAESVYVAQRQEVAACTCTYRLRISDSEDYESQIQQLSKVAAPAPNGNSVVTARMPLAQHSEGVPSNGDAVRSGAVVKAWVHCGQRSLGFVWFRRVIEWMNQHGW